MKGKINSIQTLGTLDGPGIRFIAFLQGCNLRCGCCHNPETWEFSGGEEITAEDLVQNALKYREYFGAKGGITLSGGEPLMQAEFVKEVFSLCKQKGINTCLDTSGSIINEAVLEALEFTDFVLLDIKYTTDELYRENVGCGIEKPLEFLKILEEKKIPYRIRQVIIPTLNDTEENIKGLKKITENLKFLEKTELLPFKKLCKSKYEDLKIPFRFENISEPDKNIMKQLEERLAR
ncbi:MAG: pyruvate formate lyase-activating protein [Clostridia bacterium]|nr:pyruvate formate lyase-activating protein [Clostridia bacterium]